MRVAAVKRETVGVWHGGIGELVIVTPIAGHVAGLVLFLFLFSLMRHFVCCFLTGDSQQRCDEIVSAMYQSLLTSIIFSSLALPILTIPNSCK